MRSLQKRLKHSSDRYIDNMKRPSIIRRITGDILIVLVILLAADVALVMPAKINAVVLKSCYQELFVYEIFFCAVLLFALDVRFAFFTRWKHSFLKTTGWILRIITALISIVIIFFCGKVITGSLINTSGQADYAIVLGLALENGKPAPDLLQRLDTAREYLEKHPETRLILTGGNADESGKSEAAVMGDILVQHGVPENKLIFEEQGYNTADNFSNIKGMISAGDPVVVISSNYHMDRAVLTASEGGFTHVMRLPASSDCLTFGANIFSEAVLELNDLVKYRELK